MIWSVRAPSSWGRTPIGLGLVCVAWGWAWWAVQKCHTEPTPPETSTGGQFQSVLTSHLRPPNPSASLLFLESPFQTNTPKDIIFRHSKEKLPRHGPSFIISIMTKSKLIKPQYHELMAFPLSLSSLGPSPLCPRTLCKDNKHSLSGRPEPDMPTLQHCSCSKHWLQREHPQPLWAPPAWQEKKIRDLLSQSNFH